MERLGVPVFIGVRGSDSSFGVRVVRVLVWVRESQRHMRDVFL